MKHHFKLLTMTLVVLSLAALTGCKKDDPKPEEPQKPSIADKILGSWAVEAECINGTWDYPAQKTIAFFKKDIGVHSSLAEALQTNSANKKFTYKVNGDVVTCSTPDGDVIFTTESLSDSIWEVKVNTQNTNLFQGNYTQFKLKRVNPFEYEKWVSGSWYLVSGYNNSTGEEIGMTIAKYTFGDDYTVTMFNPLSGDTLGGASWEVKNNIFYLYQTQTKEQGYMVSCCDKYMIMISLDSSDYIFYMFKDPTFALSYSILGSWSLDDIYINGERLTMPEIHSKYHFLDDVGRGYYESNEGRIDFTWFVENTDLHIQTDGSTDAVVFPICYMSGNQWVSRYEYGGFVYQNWFTRIPEK